MGKDPDAQGSVSGKRDLFKEQAEIRVKHRQGSETRQVKSRGDTDRQTVSKYTNQGRITFKHVKDQN